MSSKGDVSVSSDGSVPSIVKRRNKKVQENEIVLRELGLSKPIPVIVFDLLYTFFFLVEDHA